MYGVCVGVKSNCFLIALLIAYLLAICIRGFSSFLNCECEGDNCICLRMGRIYRVAEKMTF
uniref:AlNc14C128G6872 protein n=1 Tax=Albugo laibachii Nc14 TaxID=890382 RepID=F0WK18_9STRA|nr:AlNc14C128G6872 [Albugo laibachii Nc14]|eukprot:CCA21620.1 AlNc14C128G6872 [Albugo laibachii Nc14]